MSEQKKSQDFIKEAEEYHSPKAVKERREAEANRQAQELFNREFDQLKDQFTKLQAAYQLIQNHYQRSEELAKNEQLKKNLAILATFIENLTPLINRIASYANSRHSQLFMVLQAIQTEEVDCLVVY